jgi:ABC-type multidrug transport system fused ATPase/permease subunit
MFDDTVEANIRMAKPDAAFFEIQEACKRANAHEFIVSLKDAYQTMLGVGGYKLTLGQQQKIMIARVRHCTELHFTWCKNK